MYTRTPQQRIVQLSEGNPDSIKKIPIKAVYGIVEMEVNSYLAFVTKAAVIGQIYHRKVFQVQKMELLCLAAKEAKEDHVYV